MTMRFQEISDMSDVKKRPFVDSYQSLCIQWTIPWRIWDIGDNVSEATLTTASEIFWLMKRSYGEVWLEFEAFKLNPNPQKPEEKLFMGGELVIADSDTESMWDIAIINWMRTFNENTFIPSETILDMELPLNELSTATGNFLKSIWPKIDKLVATSTNLPFITYIERNSGEARSWMVWEWALVKAGIDWLERKRLYHNDPLIELWI